MAFVPYEYSSQALFLPSVTIPWWPSVGATEQHPISFCPIQASRMHRETWISEIIIWLRTDLSLNLSSWISLSAKPIPSLNFTNSKYPCLWHFINILTLCFPALSGSFHIVGVKSTWPTTIPFPVMIDRTLHLLKHHENMSVLLIKLDSDKMVRGLNWLQRHTIIYRKTNT